MIVTGKSSMRELGVLDKIEDLLKKHKLEPVIFEGIEPNPRNTTCDKAAKIARDEKCDLITGLGGGSAMDAAKGIALSAKTGNPVWDYVYSGPDKKQQPIREALPIVCIPTIAATGSEADAGGVITNWDTNEKTTIWGDPLFPVVSIVDPELTFTCPEDYTIDGGIDIISHVFETYFTSPADSYVHDRLSEGIVRTVIHFTPIAAKNPTDLEARSQLSWSSTLALSGFINHGRGGSFPLHFLEHAVSAHYDISHGKGLGLLLPALMDFTMKSRPGKYIEMGRNVFGLTLDESNPIQSAQLAIDAMKEWLASVGRLLTFTDLEIDDSRFETMADDVVRLFMRNADHITNPSPITREGVIEIFRMTL
jgi:alcohol dehydrogenase YqhD (iron-dependent ADH family)